MLSISVQAPSTVGYPNVKQLGLVMLLVSECAWKAVMALRTTVVNTEARQVVLLGVKKTLREESMGETELQVRGR